MNTRSLPVLFLIILISACHSGNTIKPEMKPLIEAVYASGFVVAEDEYQVYSQVDGTIASKLMDDGDLVKKGDVLFLIESGQQTARSRVAQEGYEQAARNNQQNSAVLQQLKAALESARTKMLFDSANSVRYTNLLNQNATTRVEFERYRLQYENSRNEYALQSNRYRQTKDQLALELEQALSQLQIASNESGRYMVRSEVDGKIFKTMKEKGELVRRSEALAIVGRNDTFYLQLSVDELDIQRIKKGQSVLVKIDAYPDRVFKSTVEKIYPIVDKQQQSLRVDASFNEALPGDFSGLAVEANIIIRQKEKAIVIPKAALLPGDSILIKTDDGTKKIKISKGIETLDEVEVTEGLDTMQQLIVQK